MGIIRVLDEHIANQIAAGEVVERPSSVVKELVENSIDAGSTKIDVTVEEGGLQLIRIQDNGSGIEPDDIETAFYRHATSKIATGKDLFQIRSLGFRGEALPSIAAVSKVECTSATEAGGLGRKIVIEGGKLLMNQDAMAAKGTDFAVKELFYNTPARLKYMKTIQTELSHISDYVYRLALAHPGIAFTLRHNGNLLLQTTGNGDALQVLAAIYGTAAAKSMIAVESETPDYSIRGFVSRPEFTRANRTAMSTIVNGRYIRNYTLTQAILSAYHTLLPINRFPLVLLELNMHPTLVDVNVHPSKLEVRFSKDAELMQFVETAVRSKLKQLVLIPEAVKPAEKKPVVIQEQLAFYRAETAASSAIPAPPVKPSASTTQSFQAADKTNWQQPTHYGTPAVGQVREMVDSAAGTPQQGKEPFGRQKTGETLDAADAITWHRLNERDKDISPVAPKSPASPSAEVTEHGTLSAEAAVTMETSSFLGHSNSQANSVAGSSSAQERYAASNGGAAMSSGAASSSGRTQQPARESRNEWDAAAAAKLQAMFKPPGADVGPAEIPAFPELYPIGQMHGTYVIAQNDSGLFMIDQHAAHERINYEYYYEKFGNPEEASQELLIPITLEFTPTDAAAILERLPLFAQSGVHLEPFGGGSFIVRSHPYWFPAGEERHIIEEMSDWILKERKAVDLAKMREKAAILCSCKASIKANQSLSLLEIEALLDKLRRCKQPYTCPHGRPIVVSFSTYELEKMFKRVM